MSFFHIQLNEISMLLLIVSRNIAMLGEADKRMRQGGRSCVYSESESVMCECGCVKVANVSVAHRQEAEGKV